MSLAWKFESHKWVILNTQCELILANTNLQCTMSIQSLQSVVGILLSITTDSSIITMWWQLGTLIATTQNLFVNMSIISITINVISWNVCLQDMCYWPPTNQRENWDRVGCKACHTWLENISMQNTVWFFLHIRNPIIKGILTSNIFIGLHQSNYNWSTRPSFYKKFGKWRKFYLLLFQKNIEIHTSCS